MFNNRNWFWAYRPCDELEPKLFVECASDFEISDSKTYVDDASDFFQRVFLKMKTSGELSHLEISKSSRFVMSESLLNRYLTATWLSFAFFAR